MGRDIKDHYDLVVIGAGSGGIGAALAGAGLGLSVLLVEKARPVGGQRYSRRCQYLG